MAAKPRTQQPVVEPPTETSVEPASSAPPTATDPGRPPQGIVVRYRKTGNPVFDLHPKHRHVPMIDPASLVVDGKDPVLMLSRDGKVHQVARRVGAVAAAEMLTCDFVTGGPSYVRLATDAEVAAYETDQAARIAAAGKKK